jgi:hypothetical protein
LHAERRCFACGEKCHFANRCSDSYPRVNQPIATTPAPTHGASSVLVAVTQNYAQGRVNHVAMKEAHEALDVVLGMFFVNDTSAIVLFDYEASHSFISVAYVEKHNLPLALLISFK